MKAVGEADGVFSGLPASNMFQFLEFPLGNSAPVDQLLLLLHSAVAPDVITSSAAEWQAVDRFHPADEVLAVMTAFAVGYSTTVQEGMLLSESELY